MVKILLIWYQREFDVRRSSGYACRYMNTAFPDFHSFWQMGGYATTVWPAYAVVFLVLFLQFFIAKRKFRRLRQSLYQKHAQSS